MFLTSKLRESSAGVIVMDGPASTMMDVELLVVVDVGTPPDVVRDKLVKILQDAGVEHFSVVVTGQKEADFGDRTSYCRADC